MATAVYKADVVLFLQEMDRLPDHEDSRAAPFLKGHH